MNPTTEDYYAAIARLRQASIKDNAEMFQFEKRRARRLALWMIGLFILSAAFITAAVLVAPDMPESVVLLNFGLMSLAASIMAWMLQSEARRQARNYANERPLSGMFGLVAGRILKEAKAEALRREPDAKSPQGGEDPA